MSFRFWRLRLWFEALTAIAFPDVASNVMRGALGTRLPRHLFAPIQAPGGPSGLADPPRPFVLRTRHLNGRVFAPGDRFSLGVHLFSPCAGEVCDAFEQVRPFYGDTRLLSGGLAEPIDVPLRSIEASVCNASLLFLTPTELKHNDSLAPVPEFGILFARAIARLRTLANFYGSAINLDFERLQRDADAIGMMEHALNYEFGERRSSRTGQTHPLGGFTGRVQYAGELRELIPILIATQFTGVGRQTVWGKGEIEVTSPNMLEGKSILAESTSK